MDDLKDINIRFYKEVFENRNIDAIDDLVTENVIEHEQPPPGFELRPGREGVKDLCRLYTAAFNPFSVEVHAQYQDGDTVITRATFRATHSGDFAGIPATGNQLSMDLIDILRFDGNRIAEHWGQSDTAGMLAQLGVLPPM